MGEKIVNASIGLSSQCISQRHMKWISILFLLLKFISFLKHCLRSSGIVFLLPHFYFLECRQHRLFVVGRVISKLANRLGCRALFFFASLLRFGVAISVRCQAVFVWFFLFCCNCFFNKEIAETQNENLVSFRWQQKQTFSRQRSNERVSLFCFRFNVCCCLKIVHHFIVYVLSDFCYVCYCHFCAQYKFI